MEDGIGPRGTTGTQVKAIRGRHYLYEREGYWDSVAQKKKYRNYRSLGPCDEHGNLLGTQRVDIEGIHSSAPVGPLAVFWAACQQLNVVERVEKVVGDALHARIVVALALNQLTGRRALDGVSEWLGEGPLPNWLGFDADKVNRSRLDATLSALCLHRQDGSIHDRGLLVQESLTRAWRGQTREPAQYFYDVTKAVYHGSTCELAEPGYHPEGTRKNVVGFGLVVSRKNHHPVLCRAIHGGRNDTITVEETIETLQAFGLRSLTFVGDRGMVSKANLDALRAKGYHQIGIVPGTHKAAWQELSRYSDEEMEQPAHLAPRPSGALYARAWNGELMGQPVRFALVLDPMRRAAEKRNRDLLLHEAENTTDDKRQQEIRHALGGIAVKSLGRRGWRIDQDRVKQDAHADGRFLMFSTDMKLSAKDIISIYSERETIEHAFRTIKNDLVLEPLRYHRADRVHAYSTIIYIAWLLWSWVERALARKHANLSLHKAVALLERVHLVQFAAQKGRREWITRPTKLQESLLKDLGALPLLQRTHGS
jgi:hypothetical protein